MPISSSQFPAHHQPFRRRADETVSSEPLLKQPSILLDLARDPGVLRQLAEQRQVALVDQPLRYPTRAYPDQAMASGPAAAKQDDLGLRGHRDA